MTAKNLQSDKQDLINWISQLQDVSLIEKLKEFRLKLNSPVSDRESEIDQALEDHNNGTAEYIDWEEAKKELFDKYRP